MSILSGIFGKKPGINYENIDYHETFKNIGQFVLFSQSEARKQGQGCYYKKEIAEAINSVAESCNKTTLKRLVDVYPVIEQLIVYR